VLVGFLLASCASPRGLDEPPVQIPPLKPGYGRVYFTRPGELAGSAVQPEIRMNDEVVGRSVPGGFSYVDRPPGKYAVTTATEVENAVTFQLAAGETKYIKTAITPGILVGHVTPTLEFPEQGQSDINRLRYVGASARRLKRDDISSNRHPALSLCLSMILSENRCTLFRIML
jgi:hypothetical protein